MNWTFENHVKKKKKCIKSKAGENVCKKGFAAQYHIEPIFANVLWMNLVVTCKT